MTLEALVDRGGGALKALLVEFFLACAGRPVSEHGEHDLARDEGLDRPI
ncbi:hypothetical protein [Brevibacterium aurantiacum]|nr:hypothetical protein [Brevibacterium aurantiacum]